jgi:hypothetical protein
VSYQTDFENDAGWSVVDTNINLNTPRAQRFRAFLKENGVSTIIRYYASSQRPKTLTLTEAKLLSSEGYNLLPVYQDINREPSHFGAENGKRNANNALEFVNRIGQPEGSSILFAADADFSEGQADQFIIPYFEAIKAEIGSGFRLGAYGSGLVLQRLMDEGLIEIPWITMSRAFRGTKEFFYASKWYLRQVPPARTHPASEVKYDRNVLGRPIEELGAFRLDENGKGYVVGSEESDGVLGGLAGERYETAAATANAYVRTEGLNLRETPGGAIIKELSIGQAVTDLGAADVADWRRVQVDGVNGVVFGKYLREPAAEQLEALLRAAINEWLRFDKGRANEKADPYYRYVGKMWTSIGERYDGRSQDANGKDVPWSAAFISYVVRNAGPAYAKFKFAAAHSVFAHDAIQARFQELRNKPFWGYRRTEQRPSLGDIIVRNRNGNNYSFDFAENHSRYESHSDVVVEVTSNVARVIGGNVGDTVTMRSFDRSGDNIQEYDLDQDGYLREGQKIIAVLKNRASEVA